MNVEKQDVIDTIFDNKRQYTIPVYQRNYDWKKENCKELFDDIFEAYQTEKRHFLGSIVQVQQDEEGGLKHFVVVDGQQRITSIYLLLKALYDKSDENVKENLCGLIYNISSTKEFNIQDKTKLKLKPIKSDNEQFLLLMTDKYSELNKSSNIFINYNYFCKLIDDKLNSGFSIKNILTGLKKLQIVMISLKEPDDDPQVIFERINSTGEDLQLSDLIRNYLLMTDDKMERLFEEYWLPMENTIGRTDINNYFLCYLTFKIGEVKQNKAYQIFKKWADDSKLTHEELLKDLYYYSKFYSAFIGNKNDFSKEINDYLLAFKNLKQTTIYPFLFSIFRDYNENIIGDEEVTNVLLFFINYSIRRMVTGVTSNSLRGLYRTLYKRIFKSEDRTDYLNNIYNFIATDLYYTNDAMPNDTKFKESLMSGDLYNNTHLCKYLLSILENGISGIKESVLIDDSITIEHIMPQNKNNEDWRNMLGDEYESVYDNYLDTLGNLTLTGRNSELSDKAFNNKIDEYKKLSKFTTLNRDIIDKKVWNKKTIVDRADRLSSKLINDLKLPLIFGTKITSENYIAHKINDNVNYAGQNFKSFILLGEKVDVSSARDVLTKFTEYMYNLEPKRLFSLASSDFKSKNAKKALLTLDSSSLRSPCEIFDSGIYIECNKSANDIINTIALLMDEFNISKDDFILYTR